MRKYLNIIFITVILIVADTTVLKASIVNELSFINEKTDFYSYINFAQMLNFISSRGISINELDAMLMDDSTNETGKVIKNFINQNI